MTDRLQRPPRKANAKMILPPIPGLSMDLDAARDSLQDDLATSHVEREHYDPAKEIAPPTTDADGRPIALNQAQVADWDKIPGYDADADMPPVLDPDAVGDQVAAERAEEALEAAEPVITGSSLSTGGIRIASGSLEWNLNMDDPKIWDGTPFIGMARTEGARFGFPMMVRSFDDKMHVVNAGKIGEEVICWAWISRDILPDWPVEPK